MPGSSPKSLLIGAAVALAVALLLPVFVLEAAIASHLVNPTSGLVMFILSVPLAGFAGVLAARPFGFELRGLLSNPRRQSRGVALAAIGGVCLYFGVLMATAIPAASGVPIWPLETGAIESPDPDPRAVAALRWLVAVTLVPVSEELLIRGVILGALLTVTRNGMAVILSSALFGLLHLPDSHTALCSAIMGLFAGWAYLRTRSLWPSIALHAVWNMGAATMRHVSSLELTGEDQLLPLTVIAASLLLLAVLLFRKLPPGPDGGRERQGVNGP